MAWSARSLSMLESEYVANGLALKFGAQRKKSAGASVGLLQILNGFDRCLLGCQLACCYSVNSAVGRKTLEMTAFRGRVLR